MTTPYLNAMTRPAIEHFVRLTPGPGRLDPAGPRGTMLEDLVAWISAVPFERWPQQRRVDENLRPAMVNDLAWEGFGQRTDDLVECLVAAFRPEHGKVEAYNRMLSVVMPMHAIDTHRDEQPAEWLTRVHVPLLTNPRATMALIEPTCTITYHLEVGFSYLVDTRVWHAVANKGATPRVHFMFDVRRA